MRTLMRSYINRSFFHNTFKAIQLSVLHSTLEKTRNLKMKRVDFIDFMLKSTFRQPFIDGSLTVHL